MAKIINRSIKIVEKPMKRWKLWKILIFNRYENV